jgi:hypothetical protein
VMPSEDHVARTVPHFDDARRARTAAAMRPRRRAVGVIGCTHTRTTSGNGLRSRREQRRVRPRRQHRSTARARQPGRTVVARLRWPCRA